MSARHLTPNGGTKHEAVTGLQPQEHGVSAGRARFDSLGDGHRPGHAVTVAPAEIAPPTPAEVAAIREKVDAHKAKLRQPAIDVMAELLKVLRDTSEQLEAQLNDPSACSSAGFAAADRARAMLARFEVAL